MTEIDFLRLLDYSIFSFLFFLIAYHGMIWNMTFWPKFVYETNMQTLERYPCNKFSFVESEEVNTFGQKISRTTFLSKSETEFDKCYLPCP